MCKKVLVLKSRIPRTLDVPEGQVLIPSNQPSRSTSFCFFDWLLVFNQLISGYISNYKDMPLIYLTSSLCILWSYYRISDVMNCYSIVLTAFTGIVAPLCLLLSSIFPLAYTFSPPMGQLCTKGLLFLNISLSLVIINFFFFLFQQDFRSFITFLAVFM